MKRTLLTAAAIAATTLAVGAGTAGAANSCWRSVINDWYVNGRLDSTYSVSCYRDTLKHLTPDLEIYSDLPEKINRALSAALLAKTSDVKSEKKTVSRGLSNVRKNGPVERVLDRLGPDRADSVPIPLLALAGVALLLIAAGAVSAVTRRLARRRIDS